MRIEQNSQYFTKQAGLGVTSNNLRKKEAAASFSSAAAREPGSKPKGKIGDSPLSFFQRQPVASTDRIKHLLSDSKKENADSISAQLANATKEIVRLSVEPVVTTVGDTFILENEAEYNAAEAAISAVMNEKKALIKSVLEKQGINGEITAVESAIYPNVYTTYYVETEDGAKNIFILELENGQLLFAETDKDISSRGSAREFSELSYELFGADQGKLNFDQLKELFARFLDVEELKDLLLEFPGTKKAS